MGLPNLVHMFIVRHLVRL